MLFRKETKILANFQVCISVPLIYKTKTITLWHKYFFYQIDFGTECAPYRWVFHFGKDLKTFTLLNLLKLAKYKLSMYLWGGKYFTRMLSIFGESFIYRAVHTAVAYLYLILKSHFCFWNVVFLLHHGVLTPPKYSKIHNFERYF